MSSSFGDAREGCTCVHKPPPQPQLFAWAHPLYMRMSACYHSHALSPLVSLPLCALMYTHGTGPDLPTASPRPRLAPTPLLAALLSAEGCGALAPGDDAPLHSTAAGRAGSTNGCWATTALGMHCWQINQLLASATGHEPLPSTHCVVLPHSPESDATARRPSPHASSSMPKGT